MTEQRGQLPARKGRTAMSKYFEFRSLEDFQSLDPDQLDKVAGGRRITKAEMDDCTAVADKCAKKKKKLIAGGRIEEAAALEDNFYRQYMEWLDDIYDAPVGSEEVLFSEVFEPYI